MRAPPRPKPASPSPPTLTAANTNAVSSPLRNKLHLYDCSVTKPCRSGTTLSSLNCEVVFAWRLRVSWRMLAGLPTSQESRWVSLRWCLPTCNYFGGLHYCHPFPVLHAPLKLLPPDVDRDPKRSAPH